MDGIDTLIDPHNEVRKLQELVKKLERQNEVLRSKQDTSPNGLEERKQNGEFDSSQTNKNNNINVDDHNEEEDHIEKSQGEGIALDDFDDVDVSNLAVVEDDSWLYAPTKPVTPNKSVNDLMSWVRQDFDHPSPDVESSKRSLISKLDEAARMKHSSSSPHLGSNHVQGTRSVTALSRSAGEGAPGLPARFGLQRKSGLAPPGGSNRAIDTGTFTRPKRGVTNGGAPPYHGEGDQGQDPTTAPNAEDIENLAKQQEESLRQSIVPSNRKGYRSKQPLVEGDTARLSPSRFDMDGMYLSQHRGSLGSDNSTPPDSPLNNQQFSLNNSADGRGGVRRGGPGVSNLQYNRSHNSSDSSLERHSVNSDEFTLAPEATRVPGSRLQPSPRGMVNNPGPRRGGLAAPQSRGLSPQRTSGLPTARRQIARPVTGTRSSLPTYRRTNIPSPKPMCAEAEENWREGCF